MEACWQQVEGSWGYFGISWLEVGGLGAILALRWGVLGPSWLQDGGFGSHLGSKLGGLGAILAPGGLEDILGVMARNLRYSWFLWGPGRVKKFEPGRGGG